MTVEARVGESALVDAATGTVVVEREKPSTAEESLAPSAQDDNRYELVRGVLTIMPPAGSNHANLPLERPFA